MSKKEKEICFHTSNSQRLFQQSHKRVGFSYDFKSFGIQEVFFHPHPLNPH
jgi:hypothetical protein